MTIAQGKKTMRIKMKKNAQGSENGYQVKEFKRGKTYDVVDELAQVFVRQMKVATFVKAKTKAAPEKTNEKKSVETPEGTKTKRSSSKK